MRDQLDSSAFVSPPPHGNEDTQEGAAGTPVPEAHLRTEAHYADWCLGVKAGPHCRLSPLTLIKNLCCVPKHHWYDPEWTPPNTVTSTVRITATSPKETVFLR